NKIGACRALSYHGGTRRKLLSQRTPDFMSEAPDALIVEDSPTQAMLLQNILEKNGFRVTWVCNGKLALEHLKTHRPTLVITDIQMPVMDGYELCHAVKTDPELSGLPVMLLTSLSAPQDIIRGLECGADNFA